MIKMHKLNINGLRRNITLKNIFRSENVIEDQELNHKYYFVKHHKCKCLNEKNDKAIELYRNENGGYVWFMIHDSFINRYKINKCPYCQKVLESEVKEKKEDKIREFITDMGTIIIIFVVIIGFICLLPPSGKIYENNVKLEKKYTHSQDKDMPYLYEIEYDYDSEGKRIIKKTYYNKITVMEKIDP